MCQFVLAFLVVLFKRSQSFANYTLGFVTFLFHYFRWKNRHNWENYGDIYLDLLPPILPNLSLSPSLAGRVVGYLTHILGIQCPYAIFLSKIYLFYLPQGINKQFLKILPYNMIGFIFKEEEMNPLIEFDIKEWNIKYEIHGK